MEWQGEKAYAHIIREVTEEKEREARLEIEAHRDPLTGIGNRHYFQEKAEELLASGESLAFGYCDLDHLKYVNDRYGHREGDWYLRHFTECVKQEIRDDDIFARIGGDEFCIILSGCPKHVAEEKLRRIQKRFAGEKTKTHVYPKSCSRLRRRKSIQK